MRMEENETSYRVCSALDGQYLEIGMFKIYAFPPSAPFPQGAQRRSPRCMFEGVGEGQGMGLISMNVISN